MKKIVFAIFFLLSGAMVFGQTWSLDHSHAKLGFSVTHLLVSNVEGSFKSFNATITSSRDDFSDATIKMTADVNSIDTDNDQRDQHLKSPDFFDATNHSTLIFISNALAKISEKKYKLMGDLTLHGVTKRVELDVTFNGTAEHPYTKKTIAGFTVSGVLKRSDFNIGNATPGAIVSDEVAISTNVEFIKG